MKPSLRVLTAEEEKKIIQEAIKLLENPGNIISNTEGLIYYQIQAPRSIWIPSWLQYPNNLYTTL